MLINRVATTIFLFSQVDLLTAVYFYKAYA